jgi:hypothetical protein
MENEDITIADVIIESMPFSDEIIAWCAKHPDFKEALKVTNADRFIALGMVQTSTPRAVPSDYVIGFTVYDYVDEIFKQDFIVDIGSRHDTFMLYSKVPSKKYGKHNQSIRSFFAKYGKDGDYAGTHHPSLADLEALNEPDLTERLHSSIEKGKLMKESGRNEISQDQLRDILEKIRQAKRQNM